MPALVDVLAAFGVSWCPLVSPEKRHDDICPDPLFPYPGTHSQVSLLGPSTIETRLVFVGEAIFAFYSDTSWSCLRCVAP